MPFEIVVIIVSIVLGVVLGSYVRLWSNQNRSRFTSLGLVIVFGLRGLNALTLEDVAFDTYISGTMLIYAMALFVCIFWEKK